MSYVTDRITNCITCGGDLQVSGRGIPTCPYCGRQYKSGVDGFSQELEEIVKRRQLREFIQAEELCRELLLKQPESSEAYWQTVLSSLGVVYVVDPETEKAKPTFFSYAYDDRDTIQNNKDYRKALQYADSAEERHYYTTQAQELDRLLKEFFSLVAKESSYDIFISFKRTTKAIVNGESRDIDTDDYKKAEEIYKYFSKKYKVFFSPVSIGADTGIEGEKYEPRILKALQTSQAMILLGSRKEYIESQWVQNEWKRYQYYIGKGKKKKNSLILAYEKAIPSLPPALKDIQLPSVDWYKAAYLKDLENKVAFVKSSKGIQSKIKERKIDASFDADEDFGFERKSDRLTIGRMSGDATIEISATEQRELDYAYGLLEAKNPRYKEATAVFSRVIEANPSSSKAYWGRFRAAIRASNEENLALQILAFGDEKKFKDVDAAIEHSTDAAFPWWIVDVFLKAICSHQTVDEEREWNKKKPVLDYIRKYLDDDRLERARIYLSEIISRVLDARKYSLAQKVFEASRALYYAEDKSLWLEHLQAFSRRLFERKEYALAAKYAAELAAIGKKSSEYWLLLCSRLRTQNAETAVLRFDNKAEKKGKEDSAKKKAEDLSLREILERTVVCVDNELLRNACFGFGEIEEEEAVAIKNKITELALYQIVYNKKHAESVIEEIASCHLQVEGNAVSANELFLRVAERYIQLKDFVRAKKYYEEILSRDPNCSKAHWGLVKCRFKAMDDCDLCRKRKAMEKTQEFENAKNSASNQEFKHYMAVCNGEIEYYDSPYVKNKKRTDGKVCDPNKQAYLYFTKKKRDARNTIIAIAVFLLVVFAAVMGVAVINAEQAAFESKKRVEATETAINSIDPIITIESAAGIIEAETMYAKLSDEEKVAVSNADALDRARASYDALIARLNAEQAALESQRRVAAAKSAIAGLDLDRIYAYEGALNEAESLYAALSEEEKASVSNYDTLTRARADLDALIAWSDEHPFTVSFSNAEGVDASMTVYYGKKYGELPTPQRTGYSFAGWSLIDSNETLTDESFVTQKADHTLYAKWSPIIYSITYVLDGGSTTNKTEYTVESEFAISAPTYPGRDFVGWRENESGPIKESVSIQKGTTGNKTFTAYWTRTYLVNYTLKGVSSSDADAYGKTNTEELAMAEVEERIFNLKIGGIYCETSLKNSHIKNNGSLSIKLDLTQNMNSVGYDNSVVVNGTKSSATGAKLNEDSCKKVSGTNINSRVGYGAAYLKATYTDGTVVEKNATYFLEGKRKGDVVDLLSVTGWTPDKNKKLKSISIVIAYEIVVYFPKTFLGMTVGTGETYTAWRTDLSLGFVEN